MNGLRSLLLILAALTISVLPAHPGAADGVPLPELAKPKGERCVEDTAFMRRNHMNLLKHQRNEVVHKGAGQEKYSWQGCVECHAATHPAVDNGKTATLYPFCQQCHEYAAVRMDCLECHSDIPQAAQAADNSKPFISEGERSRLMVDLQRQLENMQ